MYLLAYSFKKKSALNGFTPYRGKYAVVCSCCFYEHEENELCFLV